MYTIEVETPDKLFFTSDLHFNHFNICKYTHRPFASRQEMNDALIANWNAVVPKDGYVICCGDFMLNHKCDIEAYLKIMRQLNGNIVLVRGNHDIISLSIRPQENMIAVVDMAMIEVEGIKIMASHYPMLAYPADYQVFGHIHTLKDGTCYGIDGDVNEKLRKTQYDVGVDQNDYKPISYWELVDIFRNKAKEEK